jgi:hypothetical protein
MTTSHRTSIVVGSVSVVALLAVFAGRSGGDAPLAPHAKPPMRELMLAIDLSGSRSPADLKSDRQLVDEIVKTLEPGDKIVLMKVDGATRDRTNGWPFVIPPVKNYPYRTQVEQQNIDDTKTDIGQQIQNLFKVDPTAATNILGTMFTVDDFTHESGGRATTLVLFSDMIQDSAGIKFDQKGGVPGTSWIKERRDGHGLPLLTRVCVSVVGADASTKQGIAVRDFWRAYFDATGAELSNERYRQTVTEVSTLICNHN